MLGSESGRLKRMRCDLPRIKLVHSKASDPLRRKGSLLGEWQTHPVASHCSANSGITFAANAFRNSFWTALTANHYSDAFALGPCGSREGWRRRADRHAVDLANIRLGANLGLRARREGWDQRVTSQV